MEKTMNFKNKNQSFANVINYDNKAQSQIAERNGKWRGTNGCILAFEWKSWKLSLLLMARLVLSTGRKRLQTSLLSTQEWCSRKCSPLLWLAWRGHRVVLKMLSSTSIDIWDCCLGGGRNGETLVRKNVKQEWYFVVSFKENVWKNRIFFNILRI